MRIANFELRFRIPILLTLRFSELFVALRSPVGRVPSGNVNRV